MQRFQQTALYQSVDITASMCHVSFLYAAGDSLVIVFCYIGIIGWFTLDFELDLNRNSVRHFIIKSTT